MTSKVRGIKNNFKTFQLMIWSFGIDSNTERSIFPEDWLCLKEKVKGLGSGEENCEVGLFDFLFSTFDVESFVTLGRCF